MNKDILYETENFVLNYYKKNIPKALVYHNIEHVKTVVRLVEEIGAGSGLNGKDIEILKIAAWFHDIGHLKIWEGHEKESAIFADEFLSNMNYPKINIKKVIGCISATKIPHAPNNLLEKVICDADIAHVGFENFFELSDLLKLEMENRKNKKLSAKEWLVKNIAFIENNDFHTDYAKSKFKVIKDANLLALKNKINNLM